MDRRFAWEMSQMRRRDLLESAGVLGRRQGLRESRPPAGLIAALRAWMDTWQTGRVRLPIAFRPPEGGRNGEVVRFPATLPFQAAAPNPSARSATVQSAKYAVAANTRRTP